MRVAYVLLIAVVSILTVSAYSTWPEWLIGGIPTEVEPLHYTVGIITDLEQLTYTGSVTLKIICLKKTHQIVLHADTSDGKLTIEKNGVKLRKHGHGLGTSIEDVEEVRHINMIVVKTEHHLSAGSIYYLDIPFTGKLVEGSTGFYVVKDPSDPTRYLAATDFGTTFARTVFPCIDVPKIKTPFRIKLGVKENYQTFSSMPLKEQTNMESKPGWVWREFKDTPLLSTFQVSFVVSSIPLEAKQSCSGVTYWFRKDFQDTGHLACEVTSHINRLSQKVGLPNIMPNPLPKLDFILMPSFTENSSGFFGLITTKEVRDFTATQNRETLIVLYERLAWQMFGAIVSPDDIENIWVFLALGGYIGELAVKEFHDRSFPAMLQKWSIETWRTQFSLDSGVISSYQSSDGKLVEVDEDVLISDSKGVLLMRMIHKTLGGRMFKKGLRMFYDKYKYKSAGPDKLWEIFNVLARGPGAGFTQLTPFQYGVQTYRQLVGASPLGNIKLMRTPEDIYKDLTGAVLPLSVTMGQVMDTWTENNMYPVITVTRQAGDQVRVSQRNYIGNYYQRRNGPPWIFWQCYWIPLSYTTAVNPKFSPTRPKEWIGCAHGEKGIAFPTGAGKEDWIIFNNKFSGLYRVNYDEVGWNLIIKVLEDDKQYTKIHPMNRVQLVNDAMALGFTTDLSYEVVFRLLAYLRHEAEYVVWEYYILNSWNLFDGLKRATVFDKFKEYIQFLLTPLYERTFTDSTGLTGYIEKNIRQDDDVQLWKHVIFKQACNVGVPSCLSYSKDAFAGWKSSGAIPKVTEVYPQIFLMEILCTAVQEGSAEDFDFLYQQFINSKKGDANRVVYIYGVSCTVNEPDVIRLLDWTLTKDNDEFSAAEKKHVFRKLADKRKPFPITMKFFNDNFDKIYEFYDKSPADIVEYIKILGSRTNLKLGAEDEEYKQLETLVDSKSEVKDLEEIQWAFAKLKRINENNQAWLEATVPSIDKALTTWQSQKN